MIYLKDGNIPLNLAYDDDIVQEANSTYQLSFKFPLTDGKWNLLKREVFLLSDDLHGEQEFFIFEAKKANGYVQVYAKQVATLLNYYSVNTISVDRVPGQTVMTALAGSIKRNCPFTFFSDIMDRHTFNESNVSVMDALAKDKHSIVGQWGGDLVRDKYQVKLLKNGGIENESLFMYKKNLSSYEESENINNLKTRLHLKKTIQGQSEGEADRVLAVTVDSPLIGQYRQIYETDIEVNDQDVTDEASLLAYGQRYFSSTLCDLVENSINLDVKGRSDVSVKMFDTVSVFHEQFDVDLRLKITSYHFGPMSKRLKSIGFGKVSQTFGSTVASMVAGSVDKATGRLSASFEQKLQKEIDNANRHFDAEFEKRAEEINDGIEQSKAEAERYADNIKQAIDTEIAQVNQSMQAQSEEHNRQVADILSKTQSVESLANQAKSDAASAIARANQVKTEAIADARAQVATVSQVLNTAKSELQTAIASADQKARDSQASASALRNDLDLQASKILEQARAQTALASRVSTVETLADGTRSTVAELSKTVSKATGDIASVTSRTKTVEDTLGQTRTQYEALTQTVNAQTGQIESVNRKTADLQSGIDGMNNRFETIWVSEKNLLSNTETLSTYSPLAYPADNYLGRAIKRITKSANASALAEGLVMQTNETLVNPKEMILSFYVKANRDARIRCFMYNPNASKDVVTSDGYTAKGSVDGMAVLNVTTSWQRVWVKWTYLVNYSAKPWVIIGRITESYDTDVAVDISAPALYHGHHNKEWSPADLDLKNELAIYVQNAQESSAELSRRIETVDSKAVEAKTYAQQTADGFKTRIESLETYKDGESTRASQYLSASRTETAKQLTAERTAIAANYLAKSVYEEDVRGTTQKLNEIKTTADTAKQNLATYQNTVDRKLEELTSSTQTLDGKVNTASAKVDTVAGQIRTELTRVEGKIPSDLGGRNYILKSDVYATSGSRYFDTSSDFIDYARGGKYVTISLDIKGENLVPDSRGLSRIGCEIRLNLSDGKVLYLQCQKIVSGTQPRERISVTKQIPQGVSVVSANKVNMYIQVGGTALAGRPKFELSSIPSDWSAAPEDINLELVSTKTLITQTASGIEQLSTSLATTDNKVTTAETNIRQLINDVSSKVSQTDYNTLTGRMASAETAITQNAQEISKRLTSTQVESAITGKGYQTKADVDSNITGRGYATTTVLENKVRETADSFSRSITETRALIPSVEGLATVTALHAVNDKVDSHTRAIGAVGTAGSILDNVSRVTQTANGLVQEVSGSNGLKTQVSQLAGSYAIQNLTNSGTVLNQLNLNKDGSVKIDGKLVQITGTTYIQDGVITSAKIAGLDAGKITTGTLDAARIAVNSIDGSKMVFDQAFVNKMTANEAYLQQLFAKNAFITQVQAVTLSASQIVGGLMRATNGAMEVNLNAGQILYYTDQAALKRVLTSYPTQFIKFATGTYSNVPVGNVVIGSNRWASSGESHWDGGFAGFKIWNGMNASKEIDIIEAVGDEFIMRAGSNESNGFIFNTAGFGFVPRVGNRAFLGDASRYFKTGDFENIYLHQKGIRVNLVQLLRDMGGNI
ncbi:phage tail spike protein [Streptococcus suis]|uniref:phage tail spike protein n=1 Tax=Streptococcus suis TaxID=1307 RepID=UPI001ABE3AA2|nr:phage tail protein [Streptococcus suis]